MKKQYTVGSLFAGVGGICLGFMNAKNPDTEYIMSWANEIDEFACETYRTNFNHTQDKLSCCGIPQRHYFCGISQI